MTAATPLACAFGISPAEIHATNAAGIGPIGDIVFINTDHIAKYLILTIETPANTTAEQQNLRVTCNTCHASLTRAQTTTGTCPKCGSTDLTYYNPLPPRLLTTLTLQGTDGILTSDGTTYVTTDLYPPGTAIQAHLYLNLPFKPQVANKHWEAYITYTTSDYPSLGADGITAGVTMRVLLDTPQAYTSATPIQTATLPLNGAIGGSLLLIILIAYTLNRRTNKKTTTTTHTPQPKPVAATQPSYKAPFTIRQPFSDTIRGIPQSVHYSPTQTSMLSQTRQEPTASHQPITTTDIHKIEDEIDIILKLHQR
jgi:hypothetical protein